MDFVAWCVACFGSEITLWNKKFELGPKFCPFIPFLFNLGIFGNMSHLTDIKETSLSYLLNIRNVQTFPGRLDSLLKTIIFFGRP